MASFYFGYQYRLKISPGSSFHCLSSQAKKLKFMSSETYTVYKNNYHFK